MLDIFANTAARDEGGGGRGVRGWKVQCLHPFALHPFGKAHATGACEFIAIPKCFLHLLKLVFEKGGAIF